MVEVLSPTNMEIAVVSTSSAVLQAEIVVDPIFGSMYIYFRYKAASGSVTTGAVLGRQNTSSEQPPLPPNMAAANFFVITTGEEGCALNGTAVAAVLINQ